MSNQYTYFIRTINNTLDIKAVSLASIGMAPVALSPVTNISVAMSNGSYPAFGSSTTLNSSGTATTNGITYNVYTFTTISTTSNYTVNYTCASPTYCYVLAVGGGGAGGGGGGGGGGAGGVVMMPVYLSAGTNQNIYISVGGGGAVTSTSSIVNNGANTTVTIPGNTIVANGGGGSNYGYANWINSQPLVGGSNGGYGWSGGLYTNTNNVQYYPPNTTSYNYGNYGGISASNQTALPGGGGGAGTAGIAGTALSTATGMPGNGGNGIQCFLPGIRDFNITSASIASPGVPVSSLYWGGGGGGAGHTVSYSYIIGNGGLGGGGGGSNNGTGVTGLGGTGAINNGSNGGYSNAQGGNAGNNTGGGGGGSWGSNGGAGGSGIVIIAFPTTSSVTTNQSAVLPTTLVSSNLYSDVLTNTSFSTSAYNTFKGAFATRLVNYNYYGPIMTLRLSNDTYGQYTQNFYSDVCGNLGTSYMGTGQSVASWLASNGANTTGAYITKWYNQGLDPSFNCAVQYTLANQPIYDVSYGVVNFGYSGTVGTTTGINTAASPSITLNTGAYFKLPDGALPYGDASYSYITKHWNVSNSSWATFISGGTGNIGQAYSLSLGSSSSKYAQEWYSTAKQDGIGTVSVNTVLSATYASASSNEYLYVNGSLASGVANPYPTGTRSQTVGNNAIGANIAWGNAAINGQLYYMYILNSSLSSTDRPIIESTPTVYRPLPTFSLNVTATTTTSFTATWSAVTNASYYLMFINSSYYGVVTSGSTFTINMNISNSVNIYAYNASNNIIATCYYNTNIPKSIPGLLLWLDGQDPLNTGVKPLTGDTITTWYDKSGGSRNVTSAGTAAVLYNRTAMNGYPTLIFTYSSSASTITTYFTGNISITGPIMYGFFVYSIGSGNSYSRIIGLGLTGQADQVAPYLALQSAGNTFSACTNGSASNPSGTFTQGTAYLYDWAFDGKTRTMKCFNGSDNLFSDSSITNFNISNIGIGSGMQGTYYNGYLSEVIIYNLPLTASNIYTIEGYLSWKYGIQTNLPSTHPYRNSRP